jgi:heterotetrameric sarcosine oxidase gamma subunit
MSEALFESPLEGQTIESEGVRLEDFSGRVILEFRGAALDAAFDRMPSPVGAALMADGGALARLRPDRALYISGGQARISPCDGGVTVTDLTHAYGILSLSGPRAPELLAELCGLDFHDSTFPALRAAQTSLAKVPALIVRLDSAYWVLVARSLAAYVWSICASGAK